jgi:hypothetical protein
MGWGEALPSPPHAASVSDLFSTTGETVVSPSQGQGWPCPQEPSRVRIAYLLMPIRYAMRPLRYRDLMATERGLTVWQTLTTFNFMRLKLAADDGGDRGESMRPYSR